MAKAEPNENSTIEEHAKLVLLQRKEELLRELAFKQKLLNIFAEASSYKEQYSQNWSQYIEFFRGGQWPKRMASYKVPAVLNTIVENIERKTALLTDSKPIPRTSPRNEKYRDTADVLNLIISDILEDSMFGQASSDLVDNAQMFGAGYMGCLYDKGQKDVVLPAFDPRAVYFDPLVMRSYQLCEGEYVILEDVWPLEKAKDMFPKRADMFRPDAGLSRFRADSNKGFIARSVSKIYRSKDDQVKQSEIPRVFVRDFYLKDRSKTENKKYEFKNAARKTVLVGEIIADDGENPYNDGQHPVDMLTWHRDYNSAFGWGDVELLKSPQEMQNKILATIVENVILMANAIWVGDKDALDKADWQKLNNAPGSYVKINPGRVLKRESGVPLPANVLEVLSSLGIASEKITGMVDVMRGIRSGQVSSGVGIESLQMMAQALIRLRARSLEAMQARIGRKLISRIFQFYSPERIFAYLGVNERQQGEQAISSELIKPINARKDSAWTDVAFRIEPGSSLEMAKTQKRVESMRLREMQVIDDRALLEDLEYAHREEVLKRVDDKRADEQNQEVAGQQGPGNSRTQFPNQSGASPKGRF